MSYILIADDDCHLHRLVADALRREGHTIDAVESAVAACRKLSRTTYDLAIVDWNFTGETINGLDIITTITKHGRPIPILLLTGRGSLIDRVTGLSCGADDYLAKPFYLPELLARVNALLRRSTRTTSSTSCLTIDALTVDFAHHRCIVKKEPVELTRREFAIVEILARHTGTVVRRDEIVLAVWGDVDRTRCSNTLDVHIRRIREKLGIARDSIATQHGVGYRLGPSSH